MSGAQASAARRPLAAGLAVIYAQSKEQQKLVDALTRLTRMDPRTLPPGRS